MVVNIKDPAVFRVDFPGTLDMEKKEINRIGNPGNRSGFPFQQAVKVDIFPVEIGYQRLG